MPIVARNDGVQFVSRAYRESLAVKKQALLKREAVLLERDNGSFVRLYLNDKNKNIEAVFSHEGGYLLGETVWHFFQNPDNLIYCELLPSGEHVILVSVRDGKILVDAEIPYSHLEDEFSTIFVDDTAYDIYLYGDVSLGRESDGVEFVLADEAINSLTQLEESVFLQLPTLDSLALVSLTQALRALRPQQKLPIKTIVIIVAFIGLGIVAWQLLKSPPPPSPPPKVTMTPKGPPPDPLKAYKDALTSPTPLSIFVEVAQKLQVLYGISGWKVTSIKVDSAHLEAKLTPIDPSISIEPLMKWANLNKMKVTSDANSATLYLPFQVKSRPRPVDPMLRPILDLAHVLQIRLQKVALPEQIKIGKTSNKKGYRQADVTVSFQDVAPEYLVYLGNAIDGLPVILTQYTLLYNNGLISGSVGFAILGK